ncbi:hypothetical protein J6590_100906 [Homalodisca vitripennis]|nr:hypothetical protein J6590_100906 [Homalodisca vitripennis]
MEDTAKSHWTFFVVHFIPDHEFFIRSVLARTVRPLSGLQKMPAGIGEVHTKIKNIKKKGRERKGIKHTHIFDNDWTDSE